MKASVLWPILLLGIPFLVVAYKLIVKKDSTIADYYKEVRIITNAPEDFVEKVRVSMQESHFYFIKAESTGCSFTALVVPSLFSWSEIVKVVIQRSAEGSRVVFKSKCVFPFQLYAWGKNKRNAERFFSNLHKHI